MIIAWDKHDKEAVDWVSERTGNKVKDTAVTFTAREGDCIVGVVAFNEYQPGINMEVHIALDKGIKLTKAIVSRLFEYPFRQLSLIRLSARIAAGNFASRKLARKAGFVEEGIVRKGYGTDDMIIYGMLAEECKWLGGKNDI